jgi:hypothetical protein
VASTEKPVWALRNPGIIAMAKIALTWQPFMDVTALNLNSICDMVYGVHGKVSLCFKLLGCIIE